MNDAEAIRLLNVSSSSPGQIFRPATASCWRLIGAEGWDATTRPLGTYADELLRSAGQRAGARVAWQWVSDQVDELIRRVVGWIQ
jgi:hypothetical protein